MDESPNLKNKSHLNLSVFKIANKLAQMVPIALLNRQSWLTIVCVFSGLRNLTELHIC
jgi:hypothetical protein